MNNDVNSWDNVDCAGTAGVDMAVGLCSVVG